MNVGFEVKRCVCEMRKEYLKARENRSNRESDAMLLLCDLKGKSHNKKANNNSNNTTSNQFP